MLPTYKAPSFLIVKTSALGDILQSLPAVAFLKEQFPGCAIDWVAEEPYRQLLEAHPDIRKVIGVDTKKWRGALLRLSTWRALQRVRRELKGDYDAIFDLQGNTKSALWTLWAQGKKKVGFDAKSVPEWPNLLVTNIKVAASSDLPMRKRYLTVVGGGEWDKPASFALKLKPEEERRLEELVRNVGGSRVMVAFASRWPNKEVGDEVLAEALQGIPEAFFYFIYGSEEEGVRARRFEAQFPGRGLAVGSLSLPLWQALMRKMDRIFAIDSAALHLAATTEVATWSVFGPSSCGVYKPQGARHRALQGACPYGVVFKTRCPALRTCKTGACLKGLKAKELREFLIRGPGDFRY